MWSNPLFWAVIVVCGVIILRGIVAFFSQPAYPRSAEQDEKANATIKYSDEHSRGGYLDDSRMKGMYQETGTEKNDEGTVLRHTRGEWRECYYPDERAQEIANRDGYRHDSWNPSRRDATGPEDRDGHRVY